jgi:hypothetical protein
MVEELKDDVLLAKSLSRVQNTRVSAKPGKKDICPWVFPACLRRHTCPTRRRFFGQRVADVVSICEQASCCGGGDLEECTELS